jgi:perosamine synthetase
MIPRREIHMMKGELFKITRMLLRKKEDCFRYIKEFEEAFRCFTNTEYAVSVNSGRNGLKHILESLELNRGDEVIIPAYTLKDLIPIILSLGLKPVPADIDPDTFNIDPGAIIKKITKRTKVILATHIFGAPCRIDRIMDIAKDRSIFVIEDCAHSLGSEFNGRVTGSFGDAAFFSFETIKPVNAYGGGMVVTNNEKIASRARKASTGQAVKGGLPLKKIITAFFEHCLLGTPLSFPGLYLLALRGWHEKIYNFYRISQRLSASKNSFTGIQAFLGVEKLKTLKERAARRQVKADLFKSLLDLRNKPQRIIENSVSNYYFFVSLLSADAWRIRKMLLAHGVDAGIKAEIADDCAGFLSYNDCPNAKEVFDRAIQLPLHEGLSRDNINRIAYLLNKNC